MNYQGNNPEGYPDPTANQAVGIVSREEKEAAKAKKRRKYSDDQQGKIYRIIKKHQERRNREAHRLPGEDRLLHSTGVNQIPYELRGRTAAAFAQCLRLPGQPRNHDRRRSGIPGCRYEIRLHPAGIHHHRGAAPRPLQGELLRNRDALEKRCEPEVGTVSGLHRERPQPIRTRRKISHDGIRVYPPDHGGTIRNQMATSYLETNTGNKKPEDIYLGTEPAAQDPEEFAEAEPI